MFILDDMAIAAAIAWGAKKLGELGEETEENVKKTPKKRNKKRPATKKGSGDDAKGGGDEGLSDEDKGEELLLSLADKVFAENKEFADELDKEIGSVRQKIEEVAKKAARRNQKEQAVAVGDAIGSIRQAIMGGFAEGMGLMLFYFWGGLCEGAKHDEQFVKVRDKVGEVFIEVFGEEGEELLQIVEKFGKKRNKGRGDSGKAKGEKMGHFGDAAVPGRGGDEGLLVVRDFRHHSRTDS